MAVTQPAAAAPAASGPLRLTPCQYLIILAVLLVSGFYFAGQPRNFVQVGNYLTAAANAATGGGGDAEAPGATEVAAAVDTVVADEKLPVIGGKRQAGTKPAKPKTPPRPTKGASASATEFAPVSKEEAAKALGPIKRFVPGPNESLNVTLWIPKQCTWERDFLIKDLIQPAIGGKVTLRELDPQQHVSWDRTKDSDLIDRPDESNIVVFHGMIEDAQKCHNTIVEKCQYYQPAVAFIFSDEQGASRCPNEKLSHLVPVTFRHYSGESHGFPASRNVFNLPLGTNSDQVYPARDELKKASERELVWSFAGASKHERKQMIDLLQKAFPDRKEVHLDKPIPKDDVAKLYLKSIFVPNTRGYLKLDCFRLYEAARAGAIPVMVGPADEMEKTFGHFIGSEGKMPPWILASSWEDAVKQMLKIVESPEEMDKAQAASLDWWEKSMHTVVSTIRRAVAADYTRRRLAKALGGQFREAGYGDVADWLERVPDPTLKPAS